VPDPFAILGNKICLNQIIKSSQIYEMKYFSQIKFIASVFVLCELFIFKSDTKVVHLLFVIVTLCITLYSKENVSITELGGMK